MRALNVALAYANDWIRTLQENAFWLAVGIILSLHVKRVLSHRRRTQPQQVGYSVKMSQRPREKSEDQIREEMRRVRLQQQELAIATSREAEERRREKEAIERERKNQCAKPPDPKGGSRLGRGGEDSNPSQTASAGYNPMQPWTSHSRGFR
jgi:flagellar biosynthesis/type III secretory pathway M-ring protein FliF/YscJ